MIKKIIVVCIILIVMVGLFLLAKIDINDMFENSSYINVSIKEHTTFKTDEVVSYTKISDDSISLIKQEFDGYYFKNIFGSNIDGFDETTQSIEMFFCDEKGQLTYLVTVYDVGVMSVNTIGNKESPIKIYSFSDVEKMFTNIKKIIME